MRTILFSLLVVLASSLPAQDYVRGYYRGPTYVAPHYRSYSDGNFYNNWSTYGNVNPYTGSYGTRIMPPVGYGGYRPSYYAPSYYSAPPARSGGITIRYGW